MRERNEKRQNQESDSRKRERELDHRREPNHATCHHLAKKMMCCISDTTCCTSDTSRGRNKTTNVPHVQRPPRERLIISPGRKITQPETAPLSFILSKNVSPGAEAGSVLVARRLVHPTEDRVLGTLTCFCCHTAANVRASYSCLTHGKSQDLTSHEEWGTGQKAGYVPVILVVALERLCILAWIFTLTAANGVSQPTFC